MTKKLTKAEFIERAKQVHGDRYDYSESHYTASYKPLAITCNDHGPFLQTPSNHFSGKGCPACGGRAKLDTALFIERSKKVHGGRYDYSKSRYFSNNIPVEIICPEHGSFMQRPAGHMKGGGCPKCAGVKLLTQDEFIERATAIHGTYDYSLVEYVNSMSLVTIVCPIHGPWRQTPGNHMVGKGCPKCSGNVTLTTEEFVAKARGIHGDYYDYSKTEYVRANKKVVITCPVHGDFEQTPNGHLNGHGCFLCNQKGVPAMTHETFLEKARSIHGDTFSYHEAKYDRSWEHVTIHCLTHGPFQQMPEKHLAGQGCPKCAMSGPSKAQIEVSDFLSHYCKVKDEVLLTDSKLRLDMLVPDMNLAVEYHGLVWHSTKMLTDPRKDFKKHKLAEAQGIRVIHIYEDEWALKQQIVKRLLLSAVGALPKVAARKTKVIEVGHGEAREFYNTNHLQGARQSRVNLGLQHEGVLVACMSFDMLRSSRHNKDARHWELVRYAATHTVVGGASKLLKSFRALGMCDRMTSYSDNRLFSGAMYAALGFEMTHETDPDYRYTTGRAVFGRQHKSKYQRKHLPNHFPGCDMTKTEWQICEENGLHRIYDCGKKRWDLSL